MAYEILKDLSKGIFKFAKKKHNKDSIKKNLVYILEELFYNKLITYRKIARLNRINETIYQAINVTVTLDGIAYLKENGVTNG